jgi:outer membrane protein
MPLDPVYSHSLRAEIRQPLLRGFGPLSTNAEIHIAQLDRNAAAADFEAQVQEQVRRAVELYWDLVAAVNSYNVVVIAYTAAADLLRINTAKVEAGVMARTQVLQARASVEARREAVIRARQQVRNLEDSLKQLLFFQAR